MLIAPRHSREAALRAEPLSDTARPRKRNRDQPLAIQADRCSTTAPAEGVSPAKRWVKLGIQASSVVLIGGWSRKMVKPEGGAPRAEKPEGQQADRRCLAAVRLASVRRRLVDVSGEDRQPTKSKEYARARNGHAAQPPVRASRPWLSDEVMICGPPPSPSKRGRQRFEDLLEKLPETDRGRFFAAPIPPWKGGSRCPHSPAGRDPLHETQEQDEQESAPRRQLAS